MKFVKEDYEIIGQFLGNAVPGSDRRADLLTAEAEGTLIQCLNMRLLNLYWPLLLETMKPDIAQEMPVALTMPQYLPDEARLRWERKALETLLRDGKARLGVRYPELLRREASIREGFSSLLDVVLSRIRERRAEICDAFFSGRDFGKITAVRCPGVDARPHGRTALRIETQAGPFYYKPRSCQPEAFYGVLAARFFPEASFGARLVLGEGYAFMEAVGAVPLRSHDALRTYYRNLGVLTAALFALRSGDMHLLNFIACGPRPVPIDLEFLLTSRAPGEDRRVVARTGVIHDPQEYLLYSMLYRDAFKLLDPEGLEKQVHLPELGGAARSVFAVESDYLEGFAYGYRDILNRRDSWISLLRDNADLPVRIVLRPKNYAGILKALHHPRLLASVEARDAFLESLWNPVPEDMRAAVREIEREALLNDDYPDLHMKSGEKHLYNYDGAILKRDWRDSPLSRTVDSLRQMSEAELARCVEELRSNIARARLVHSRPLL